jgi:hypothetical protein
LVRICADEAVEVLIIAPDVPQDRVYRWSSLQVGQDQVDGEIAGCPIGDKDTMPAQHLAAPPCKGRRAPLQQARSAPSGEARITLALVKWMMVGPAGLTSGVGCRGWPAPSGTLAVNSMIMLTEGGNTILYTSTNLCGVGCLI